MEKKERIEAFSRLGEKISSLKQEELASLAASAKQKNGWFSLDNVTHAFSGIAHMLQKDKLEKWSLTYNIPVEDPKVVGIVMAGNIPMVGFHDLLCVLISGHFAAIKPSSDDTFLIQTLIDWIIEIEPRFRKNLEIRDRLTAIDAVIATGSDNTARYFEYYFGKVPHIIRKNRTSVAILTGEETNQDLELLADDIFTYYGMGCRNVSKLFTPKGYDLTRIFPSFEKYSDISNHHKYRNNYDYYKSIYLVNRTPHLDTGFLLTTSSDDLVSPPSVLFHQEYDSIENLEKILTSQAEKIQCIVSPLHVPFGKAQSPELWDYADNVDVLKFLTNLENA